MLDDYSIYIDPDEDEVFFTALLEKPVITISKPNNSLADSSVEEDLEVIVSESDLNQCIDSEPCSDLLTAKASCKNEVSQTLDEKSEHAFDIDESAEVCVSIAKRDITNENRSPHISNSVAKSPKSNLSKCNDLSEDKENNGNSCINAKNTIFNNDFKENNQENATKMNEFKTPLKRSPLKLHNEKSSSKSASGKNPRRFSKMTDISLIDDGHEFELSADINESLISWSSVDVNVQLESLMTDLDFDDLENDAIENELFQLSSTPLKSENDKQLEFSWTPNGLNVCFGSQGTSNEKQSYIERARKVPSINVIEASPAIAPPPSPLDGAFNRPAAPIRFRPVYSSAKKTVASSSSSTCGSTQSFHTPVQTPVSVAKGSSIPVSNIPKPSAKKLAAKSLQFSHIESPISKYIYDKSTPLVSNMKGSKLTSNIPCPSPFVSKDSAKPQSASKELPRACYQKGIPSRQEKASESRLPRLGGNQMKVVAAVPNARVISHNPRQTDVSVLVSSPAKIYPRQ